MNKSRRMARYDMITEYKSIVHKTYKLSTLVVVMVKIYQCAPSATIIRMMVDFRRRTISVPFNFLDVGRTDINTLTSLY